eukprot:jgi/Botrbrau1/6614/Bobra.104_2s0003.2
MVHLGVDAHGKAFKLETRAFNEATFRVPDEDGYQPSHMKIDETCSESKALHTDLLLSSLEEKLWQQQHKVCLSGDAGRFLCNFIYYKSLQQAQARCQGERGTTDVPDGVVLQSAAQRDANNVVEGVRWHSLFVHVPPFALIDKEDQLRFLGDLLDQLSKVPDMHVPPIGNAPVVQVQLPGGVKLLKVLS